MYTFPELLKKIREEGDLTQEKFAMILGVSTILITLIETKKKEASKSFILKLAEKLKVSPNAITPFLFSEKDLNSDRLTKLEKDLISFGEKMQVYLIHKKVKNLKQHAGQ
jgi:transcriptional regulator with XRE-family HTH domain